MSNTARKLSVHCGHCRVALTNPLLELEDRSLLSGADGQPYLPQGHFTFPEGESMHSVDGESMFPVGAVTINLADLINTARHPNLRRLNGCCGLDGCDGLNTVCYEGHEVGTERSDCWMPHGLHFDPTLTILLPSAAAVDLDPGWLRWTGGTILKMARHIRSKRRYEDLPVLADALEDAGCVAASILDHCRHPGEHTGPCWVLDLLLRKGEE
jgi:hypothetical protein